MSTEFDVIVIGAGPGGYVAAIRCAQLGLKTACVDEWVDPEGKSSPGGTCLNVGCIPSKAMIESSELYEKAQHDYAVHGINIKDVSLNLETLLARKNKVVSELTSGIAALFVANKIGFFHGRGVLKKSKTVDVALNNGETQQLTGSNIIIATGSSPAELKIAPFDHETIVDSTDALSFDKVPEKLGVIGAGVIALELGSVWRRLGSDVTMFKSRDNFLPTADKQIGAEALKQFKAQGLKFSMGVKILKTEIQKNKVSLIYEEKGTQKTATFDKLIVAVGRYPNSRGVFDEDVGIKLNDKGLIDVDEFGKTSVAGIYAIGDVVRGPMLAHKASEEGVSVAEKIAGHTVLPVNLETVPSVIYTTPEIAWVGKTEQALE
ncbi:MAG TPA: dihydrolipoyl dehydrogenase, partial [Gammaproteobacteria bacterium]|nr:dihydrolipoyl dehydrogenase [Gammaproteobacteria bacterium]